MPVVMSLEDWIKCFVLLVAVLYIGDQSVLRSLDEMFCIIGGSLVYIGDQSVLRRLDEMFCILVAVLYI